MKPLIVLRIFIYAVCFMVIQTVFPLSIFAGSEDLKVTKIIRITHPAYRSGNIFVGIHYPWNRDNTRIMLYESVSYTHPTYNTTGRRLLWGFIDELKAIGGGVDYEGTLEQYEATAKPVKDTTRYLTNPESAHWSPFEGEENIIYAPFTTGHLVKINVDTDTITNVLYFGAKRGTKCYDWTTDNKLICSLLEEDWSEGGYEIDVQIPSKRYISSKDVPDYFDGNGACKNSETIRWPVWKSHGHHAKSPSGRYVVNYYKNQKGKYDLFNCTPGSSATYIELGEVASPKQLSHFSWTANDNWFIADDRADFPEKPFPSHPEIQTFRIYQMWIDGTIKPLIEMQSAQGHYVGNTFVNYQSRPLPTLRKDGKQILFTSTNGKYSYADYLDKGVKPWGFTGFFLADLAPPSGVEPDPVPSPPTGLKIK